MREFHCPSLVLAEQVSRKCKDTLKLVQKTKHKYYQKITTGANTQNIWKIRDWTRQKKTFISPPFSTGDNSPPAITHKQSAKSYATTYSLNPQHYWTNPQST